MLSGGVQWSTACYRLCGVLLLVRVAAAVAARGANSPARDPAELAAARAVRSRVSALTLLPAVHGETPQQQLGPVVLSEWLLRDSDLPPSAPFQPPAPLLLPIE